MDKVEAYIKAYHQPELLNSIRIAVKKFIPEAVECFSYGMPAFKYNNKPLLYFGGFKNHVGLYALPTTNKKLSQKLLLYKTGKGSIQIPLSSEFPFDLLTEILALRKSEIDEIA